MRFVHKLQIIALAVAIPLLLLYTYAEHEDVSIRDFFTSGAYVARVDGVPMSVLIVDDDEERQKGLSGREKIGAAGMLFVFDKADYHGIWMKDMLFAIDIIWIDESLTVVGVERSVRPDTYPRTFHPPSPARYAIETEERYTDIFGINVGDTVELPINISKAKFE